MKRAAPGGRLGVVMDPIGSIVPERDSTLAMLLEAQSRGWRIEYMELGNLRLRDATAEAFMRPLTVRDDASRWFELGEGTDGALAELDLLLMRKDPPVDFEYVVATYILERAEEQGLLVANRPRALRDVNEKACTAWFPECCPPALLTRSKTALLEFLAAHGTIVVKPLDAMGGRSVYVIRSGDPNTNVILEEISRHGGRYVQAQAYAPGIAESGDKRILLVDGEPLPQAIARTPAAGELRANLSAGATPSASALTDRDRRICERIGPALRERGLFLVGIDVIAGYLTEVNVTSPTGMREIERLFGVNVAAGFLDALESRLPR